MPNITNNDGFRNLNYRSNNKRFDRKLIKIKRESRQLNSEIQKLKNVGGNRFIKKIGGKSMDFF